jgi:HSP20 family molecular chaperone IbpA
VSLEEVIHMLARWDPWPELADLQRQMSNLTRSFFGDVGWPAIRTESTLVPAVDVFSRDDDLVARAELPGVDPERDIDVSASA